MAEPREPAFGSLVWRPNMYGRNDVSYLVARSWRADVKKADVEALKAAKAECSAAVLDAAAADLAEVLRTLGGRLDGWTVTTVPCGHSRRPDCFARQLAERVAALIGCPFVQVWADRYVSGVSHPKEFKKLPPLEWLERPTTPVLLVDDVATSGWHIEEGLTALRSAGLSALGLVWIGGTVNNAQVRQMLGDDRPRPVMAAPAPASEARMKLNDRRQRFVEEYIVDLNGTQAATFFRASRDHFATWRRDTREDYGFVAGSQWSEEDKAALAEQLRPVVTFNRIGPVIDSVTGSEVNNRQEVRYIPREMGDVQVNELLTGAAKWVRDECDAEDEESDAFVDAVICGMGWTETYIDMVDDPDGAILIRRVDPLEMVPDPMARQANMADAKRVMRVRKVERQFVRDTWPEAAADITSDAAPWTGYDEKDGDPHDADEARFYRNDQESARGADLQHWTVAHYQVYRTKVVWALVDPMTGELTEMEDAQYQVFAKRAGQLGLPVQSVRRHRRYVYEAFICGKTVLKEGEAPCPTSFSYRAITGKRDRNAGTWYGLVRGMKDPQRWANKWLSQTMHIINSNAKGGLLAEQDAFVNPRKAEAEWSRPDAITLLKHGGLAKIKEKAQTQYPQGIVDLMTFAISSIRDVSGVNLELLGMADRDQPGILEQQRSKAALTVLAGMFNSLRRYRKEQGRLLLHMITRYISDGRLIRITGGDGAERYLPLVRLPDTVRFDVIVDDAPTSPNQKEQAFAVLMQLLPMLLPAGIPIPPEVVEYAPIPASLAAKWKEMLVRMTQPKPPSPAAVAQAQRIEADTEQKRSAAILNVAKAEATRVGARVDALRATADALAPPAGPAPQPLPPDFPA